MIDESERERVVALIGAKDLPSGEAGAPELAAGSGEGA